MSTIPHLNYTILGLPKPDVFPLEIKNQNILVQEVIRDICVIPDPGSELWLVWDNTTLDGTMGLTLFFQLKEPIPFDQIHSTPWLLDKSTNLMDYATRLFRAEKLFDVWTTRDHRSLHAIMWLGTPFTLIL